MLCLYSVWVGSFPCIPIQNITYRFSLFAVRTNSCLDQGYAHTFSLFLSALHSTVGTWCDQVVSDDAHLAVYHTNLGLRRIAVEQSMRVFAIMCGYIFSFEDLSRQIWTPQITSWSWSQHVYGRCAIDYTLFEKLAWKCGLYMLMYTFKPNPTHVFKQVQQFCAAYHYWSSTNYHCSSLLHVLATWSHELLLMFLYLVV